MGDRVTATAKATREAVAAAIRSVVPDKWVVYAWPHTIESLPCVIVEPRAPYQERGSFRERDLHLGLTVLHPVATGEYGGAVVDDLLDDLLPALDQVADQGIAWVRVSSVGDATERAGRTAVGASIDLSPIAIT